MGRGRPRKNPLPEQNLSQEEETNLEKLELPNADALTSEAIIDNLTSSADNPENKLPSEPPQMDSPEWNNYVMSKFTDDELQDGNPTVAGLRRVARLLLGKTRQNFVEVQNTPAVWPDSCSIYKLTPTVVKYTLLIWKDKNLDMHESPYELRVEDVADCYWGNAEPKFCVHPSAMASTRAEARCLRKALQISNVSADEVSTVEVKDDEDGPISETQIDFIEMMLQRANINGEEYLKGCAEKWKKKFNHLEDLTHGLAARMCENLGELFRDKSRIVAKIQGYKQDWRKV